MFPRMRWCLVVNMHVCLVKGHEIDALLYTFGDADGQPHALAQVNSLAECEFFPLPK